MISDHPIVKKIAWTSGTRRTGASMDTHREYIVEIPDYVPPFDPAVRTASLGEEIVRCRDCKHGHITIDGKHCKWCDLLATHDPDGDGDPPNGYDPEPYFDAGFFCAWGERRDA